jgi:hypothetical protein
LVCSKQEFLSWSDARPAERRFDPRQRFFADGPWDGSQNPQQIASSTLKLRHARRTAQGRLSNSTKTRALVLASTDPQALEFGDRLFTSWDALFRYAWQKKPLGLRQANPLDLIAVVEPAGYGSKEFDSITQTLIWNLYDEAGSELTLSLPFRDWSKESVAILEKLLPQEDSRWRFVVRLELHDDELGVEPVSILRANDPEPRVFQLAFDALPQPTSAGVMLPEDSSLIDIEAVEDEEMAIADTAFTIGSYRDRVISELNGRLQRIAEAGFETGILAYRDWYQTIRGDLYRSGLTVLSKLMKQLAGPSPSPALLLKARFLALLHSQAASHIR